MQTLRNSLISLQDYLNFFLSPIFTSPSNVGFFPSSQDHVLWFTISPANILIVLWISSPLSSSFFRSLASYARGCRRFRPVSHFYLKSKHEHVADWIQIRAFSSFWRLVLYRFLYFTYVLYILKQYWLYTTLYNLLSYLSYDYII